DPARAGPQRREARLDAAADHHRHRPGHGAAVPQHAPPVPPRRRQLPGARRPRRRRARRAGVRRAPGCGRPAARRRGRNRTAGPRRAHPRRL
ncbi:MAG: hypothetical protein AVDCRST_MAG48-3565, partial [uncultured Friedmanniella sp.]